MSTPRSACYGVVLCLAFGVSSAFTFAPAQDAPSDRIKDMIRRLGDSDVAARDKAQKEIVHDWEKWSDADLAELGKAGGDSDAERAGRAKQALRDIVQFRSFATHLAITIDKLGAPTINGQVLPAPTDDTNAAALAKALTAYAVPPKDPTGKRVFKGLRVFIDADKEAGFQRVYAVIAAAQKNTPLSEVILMDPMRKADQSPASPS